MLPTNLQIVGWRDILAQLHAVTIMGENLLVGSFKN
jgi:hypothetical protein